MATVDLRQDDGDMQIDTSLKLWLWDGPTISWTLNTRIDRPHGNSAVTCVAFQPPRSGAPPTMMTTGEDGAIKVWRLRGAKPGRKADDGKSSVEGIQLSLTLIRLLDIPHDHFLPIGDSDTCNMVARRLVVGSHCRTIRRAL
jgi:WD40 repeat protein